MQDTFANPRTEPPAFTHVISLGGDCEVAWAIRHIFDQPQAYPFDWLVVPPTAVIAHLRNACAAMVNGAALEASAVHDANLGRDRHIVIDSATGTQFHHDFPDTPEFRPHAPRVAEKYTALAARLFALSAAGAPVLFVQKGQPAADDAALLAALDAYLPGTQARLLVVDPLPNAAANEAERITRRRLDIAGRGSWEDTAPKWRRILTEAAQAGLSAGRLRLA
ncbi:DUF1796 family putative cysteine peptidase [Plastoroseomonas arctica]|uniref:Uncharacterized protein n=1 Tax=Plastoroseomonas arctica TaxID=1509237 RepID=A0AAF1KMN0_9PROT|nr:DUF1796 family putative cysteine peptidase [Plastoroseomonas arctica]MBR0656636.1 hypothetical protein [Plastoroseomonas arctica]